MFATHFYERNLLNTFRNIPAVGISNLFLGLYLSNPSNTGQGGIEVSYQGYARIPITFTPPYIENERVGIRNPEALMWNSSPTDAGEARFIGISDASTAGNMLLYGELTTPLEIRANQQPSVSVGSIRYFMIGEHTREWKTRALNVLRGQTFSGFVPHIGLFGGDPQAGGVELAGEAYERVSCEFSSPTIEVGGQSRIINSVAAEFNEPLSEWGNWAWTALMESGTSGAAMATIRREDVFLHRGYKPVFGEGSITITLD